MSKTVNLFLAAVFAFLGFFMAMIGLAVLAGGPSNETEWTIGVMGVLAALFLFVGAWQTFKATQRKAAAETHEAERLSQKFAPEKRKAAPFENRTETAAAKNQPESKTERIETSAEPGPKIYVRWIYTPKQWHVILQKLGEKTHREEMYTAFWFPILFAIVFFSQWYYGAIAGVFVGFLYIKFRVYFVKTKFALKAASREAEIIISDSYLRVNGNFIHYADGHYYLKNLSRESDKKMGDLLLFNIGWTTGKGYPAEMDLYLPIPEGHQAEAETVLRAFKQARA